MRAQVSVEYLIVVGIALLILIPAILYANQILSSSKKELRMNLAENAVERLAENADWVYSLGPPSRVSLTVYIPEYVEYVNISDHKISIKLKDYPREIFKNTKGNVTGYIPPENGYYKVWITAEVRYVNISVVS